MRAVNRKLAQHERKRHGFRRGAFRPALSPGIAAVPVDLYRQPQVAIAESARHSHIGRVGGGQIPAQLFPAGLVKRAFFRPGRKAGQRFRGGGVFGQRLL